jgi:hypothetical protein
MVVATFLFRSSDTQAATQRHRPLAYLSFLRDRHHRAYTIPPQIVTEAIDHSAEAISRYKRPDGTANQRFR